MAKTDWGMEAVVMPDDMNQIGQEVNEALSKANAAETPADAQAKANAAGLAAVATSKSYTDSKVAAIPAPPVTSVAGKTGAVTLAKGDVGLGNVPNYPASSQAQAEAGSDNATLMTPLRAKQYVDKRLLNNLQFRINAGAVEYWDGTEWITVGNATLSDYFSQYGSFPFNKGAVDVVISANTTWSDASGFRRVRKLTINAGITLRIDKTPFVIFADEIAFGSAASTIDISGPSASESANFSTTSFAAGGTLIGDPQTTIKAQGGCGGGFLVIVAKKISGAAGVIKANGGNGYISGTGTATNYGGSPGRGALGIPWQHPIALMLGSGGGPQGGTNGGSGGGQGSSAYGGSGFGGGGGVGTPGTGQQPFTPPNVTQMLELFVAGCKGGGGGSCGLGSQGAFNFGSGGGGGGIVVLAEQLASTPSLQANGGLPGTRGDSGAAGITQIVLI